MDSHEKLAARRNVVSDLVGGSCATSSKCRSFPWVARIVAETIIDEWSPDYAGVDGKSVELDLRKRIRPKVRERIKAKKQEYGFITVSFVLMAIISGAISAVVNFFITRWLNNSAERSALVLMLRLE